VPVSGGDDGDGRGTEMEGVRDGAPRRVEPLGLFQEGQAGQHEDPNRDPRLPEEIGRLVETLERHAFVQPGQHLGMDRLEAEGDLEPAVDEVAKTETRLADEGRVRLDDDAFERADERRDLIEVAGWDGLRVEEASGVVELHAARRRKTRQSLADLLRE